MTLKNPFSDYGSIVSGNRFVGRLSEIRQIQNRIFGESFGNLAIMGLPRIGKSSLAWNSIIVRKESLLQRKIIPLWIPLGEYSGLIEFLNEVLSSTCDVLQDNFRDSSLQFKELREKFLDASSDLERRRYVKKYLRTLNSDGFRLIVVVDEFDNASNIFGLQDFQFLREVSYNVETKIGIVTISRKTIQELEPDNGSLSNFYQIFDELRLRLFSKDDLFLYWQRVEHLGVGVTEVYRRNVQYFTGQHPFLLDLINYSIFNRIEQSEIDLEKVFDLTLIELKLKLYNEYESILKLMERENLDTKLVQMIIGPVYDITQRDVETLLKYSLVRTATDDSFECFAVFFDEYLSIKAQEVDIWPLWANVERELRQIIKHRLIVKYGEEWETGFEKEFGERRRPLMESLRLIRAKNRKSFGEKASDNLIDYTYPMDMFNGFISSDWKWYVQILGAKSQLNEWNKKFEHLGRVRNPLAHNNQGFLTDSDKELATGYCKELLALIRKWRKE